MKIKERNRKSEFSYKDIDDECKLFLKIKIDQQKN